MDRIRRGHRGAVSRETASAEQANRTEPPTEQTDPQAYGDGVVRKHIVVTGLVQGVGFRYETLRRARRIGVVGWVRNCMDGSVELEVQGEPLRVASMIEWLWQGPEWSRVDDVTVESIPPLGRLEAESTFIVTR